MQRRVKTVDLLRKNEPSPTFFGGWFGSFPAIAGWIVRFKLFSEGKNPLAIVCKNKLRTPAPLRWSAAPVLFFQTAPRVSNSKDV